MFSGVTNHTSPSGNLLDKSGFAGCQGSGSCLTAFVQSVQYGGGGFGVGLLFRTWAQPLSSTKLFMLQHTKTF